MKVSACSSRCPASAGCGLGRSCRRSASPRAGVCGVWARTRSPPCCPASTRREPPAPTGRPRRADRGRQGHVASYVRDNFPEVWLSVSATTRRPRPGEVDGVHYHFVDEAEFERMREAGELLEAAVVHGLASYGTPASRWRRRWERAGWRCWRSTCRAPARCVRRCPRRCSCSSRRRAGTSWSAGWSAGHRERGGAGDQAAHCAARTRRRAGVRRDHRQRRGSACSRTTRIMMRSH